MEQIDLNRYEVTGILGAGADYEAQSAVDRETGAQMVLKRPEPQMIRRQMHTNIEARTDRVLKVYAEIGHAISNSRRPIKASIHQGFPLVFS